ncbi:MAG: cell division protein SepF [Chloroflexi bacterium]|nr:cell division protein SepF [Chloroflexota bacterium]
MAGLWKRSLVYLGLMEEDEELEEMQHPDDGKVEEPTRMVRTLRREETRETTHPAGRGVVRSLGTAGPPRQVHVVEPRIYDDAQEFADRLKSGVPVIINLRLTEPKHAPKILHFASGLVYGLNGRMQKVAEAVYLITPFNVEISADEKRRLAEHGFFNDF